MPRKRNCASGTRARIRWMISGPVARSLPRPPHSDETNPLLRQTDLRGRRGLEKCLTAFNGQSVRLHQDGKIGSGLPAQTNGFLFIRKINQVGMPNRFVRCVEPTAAARAHRKFAREICPSAGPAIASPRSDRIAHKAGTSQPNARRANRGIRASFSKMGAHQSGHRRHQNSRRFS